MKKYRSEDELDLHSLFWVEAVFLRTWKLSDTDYMPVKVALRFSGVLSPSTLLSLRPFNTVLCLGLKDYFVLKGINMQRILLRICRWLSRSVFLVPCLHVLYVDTGAFKVLKENNFKKPLDFWSCFNFFFFLSICH
jgi:hypothetical protein